MRSVVLALAAFLLAPAAGGAALFPRQRMEADYRTAVAAWARGEEQQALDALTTLSLEAHERRDLARLDRAKRAVARALGRREGGAWMALARLESRMYHQLVSAKRPELALGSRLLAADLAELAAERGGAALRGPAAALLASLGGQLHLAAQEGAAIDLYGRALLVEPNQGAALLGLAALREKRGDYATAVALLSSFTPTPGGREGALRLAINLLRVGRRAEAEAALRALAADGDDWVRSVAAQELAKALAARGDLAGASAVVQSAAAAIPCDPSLAMEVAWLAERSGAEGMLDLAGLADCADAATSSRARYARPPTGEMRALIEHLETLDAGWREDLRRAVGQTGA